MEPSRPPLVVAFELSEKRKAIVADALVGASAVVYLTEQLKSNVVSLSRHRAVRQVFEEARLYADRLKDLISEGREPCHAIYIFAQNFASVLGEQLSEMKETRQFVKIASNAEDKYQPSGPPLSPLTISYFTMWALFDVLFGQSHETIGTCILQIGQLIEMPPWLLDVIGLMQRSTMGVYVHCGCEGHLVRLRALGSQETRLCHVPSGYAGHPGELWFIRQLPLGSRPLDAPADHAPRSKWLERLFEAVQNDGVEYLAPVEDRWGEIARYRDLINE